MITERAALARTLGVSALIGAGVVAAAIAAVTIGWNAWEYRADIARWLKI